MKLSDKPIVIFKNELEMIVDSDLNRFASYLLSKVPSWFYEVPASSSGYHHPPKAREIGGLIWHTKLACKIGNDLCNTINTVDESSRQSIKDLVVFSLIFHDCCKLGNSENKSDHTVSDHPLLASRFIKKWFYSDFLVNYCESTDKKLFTEKVEKCCSLIESHMGRWSSEINYLPTKDINLLVHYADYISANLHKYIDI